MFSASWMTIYTAAGLNAIIAMGLYFSNSAGALSVAHAALAGIGGYASAIFTTNMGWPFWLAMSISVVIGMSIGGVLALITSRMNELVAGLTTLAFGQVMVVLAFNWDYVGGANSFVGIRLQTSTLLVWICLLLTIAMGWWFERSSLGYAALAIRHGKRAAAAMGIKIRSTQVTVFALGAGVAALGGGLRSHYVLVQNPNQMAFWISVNYVIFWVLGGSYSFWGAAVGALLLTIIPELLRFSIEPRFIFYGLALTVLVIVQPDGIIRRVPLGDDGIIKRRFKMMRLEAARR